MVEVVVEPWSESLAISEQESRLEYRAKMKRGVKLPVPSDEELQFVYKDKWKEVKKELINEQ